MRTRLVLAIAAVGMGGLILGASLTPAVPFAADLAMQPVAWLCAYGRNHPVLRTILAIMPAYIGFLGPMMFLAMRRHSAKGRALPPASR